VEQFGAGTGTERVEALTLLALKLIGSQGRRLRPGTVALVLAYLCMYIQECERWHNLM
jgi:hypothetical protein